MSDDLTPEQVEEAAAEAKKWATRIKDEVTTLLRELGDYVEDPQEVLSFVEGIASSMRAELEEGA